MDFSRQLVVCKKLTTRNGLGPNLGGGTVGITVPQFKFDRLGYSRLAELNVHDDDDEIDNDELEEGYSLLSLRTVTRAAGKCCMQWNVAMGPVDRARLRQDLEREVSFPSVSCFFVSDTI